MTLQSTGREPALCDPCRGALLAERVDDLCTFCGIARRGRRDLGGRCANCRRRRFAFQEVVPLGAYRGALRHTVIRMKQFHEYPLTAAVGILLADELAGRLQQYPPKVVVPIPKYWLKRWLQGSSSAEVLADVVGEALRLPVARTALRWRRSTQKQSLLPLSQRRRNLTGALRVSQRTEFRGSHVLVLDDIMTTGATAGEAARVLRRAGAAYVSVGLVGRALVDRAQGGGCRPRPGR